ncbi:DUF2797 domain-containing protein [Glaciecola sp. MH2013]|uniref:DUF2797 domain-containing protein n=1 Tax=Glaciecola sp. MH2013 TaxID=2785524 RepID=UPI00189D1B4A|nr:DUF2797 domain-containing protein [Glaciecola sp. MH2013]MBF7074958.1 DUF2797 domain-containing protein [Glaciecola sp. MH2013]
MTNFSGNISKMRVSVSRSNVAQYQLPIGESTVQMNDLIGHNISVDYRSQINCIHCGRQTNKSFSQGYCYPCMTSLAQCDTCIIKPEQCHYDQGTCREPSWGEENCLTGHFVYLSNTGNTKVGITRHVSDGVSSRWIDQGASQALPILRVENRLMSGLVETALKSQIADKTNWRKMLQGEPELFDLTALRDELLANAEPELEAIKQQYGLQSVQSIDSKVLNIHYPVLAYPEKIKSINLDKELGFSGKLMGIKGQYLLLDENRVINIRKYSGYELSLNLT